MKLLNYIYNCLKEGLMAKRKKKDDRNALQKDAAQMRRKMISSRVIGIFCCLLAIACIAVYYFKVINEWLCIVILTYCMGTIFTSNSFIQDVKVGNPWQRINGIVSVILYLLVAALIVYGFVTGNLSLQFD